MSQGLYDRGKDLTWKHMKDVQVVGAMGPPGGARNAVDPRFISLFSMFEIQAPSNDNLRTIYQVSMLSITFHHVHKCLLQAGLGVYLQCKSMPLS